MPKKKVVTQEEPEQTADVLAEQTGEETPAPLGDDAPLLEALPQDGPPADGAAPDGGPSMEKLGLSAAPDMPGEHWPASDQDAQSIPAPDGEITGPEEDAGGIALEVTELDLSGPADPPPAVPEDAPAEDPPPGEGQSADEELPPSAPEDPPSLTDRQSFFALDFRELDRGLSPEERQAWNSIYASFRGRSALSGTVIGADPHSMNVRSRETGRVERRTMYCVVVLVYRVPVFIPATEMWMGEARPDFVLRNMMGASIDFIITKVDREGGYAIASRRQAARTQRYFFAHRPDLCRAGARVKCRMLSVGPRRCLAECYGHDVDLTQRELSYTAIPDLREKYHPGDELDCMVKSYDAARRELQISVKETESNPFEGAELRHPVGSRRYAVIAGKYGGGVFCNLPDGTLCMCNYSYQHEDSDFQVGDHVMLVVHRFERDKRQMYGKILSKW